MIEEKNKEMQNLTETMQKKIESINDDPSDETSKQGLDQIKSLEEKCRKYEAQIAQANKGREVKEQELNEKISKAEADLTHQKELFEAEKQKSAELQGKVDTMLEQQSL